MEDQLFNFNNGMHEGIDEIFLPDGYAHRLVNISVSSGRAQTRPPFTQVDQLADGKFQGYMQKPYYYEDETYIPFAIGGTVYLRCHTTGTIHPITSLDPAVDRIYFCQVERYLLVQDGINQCKIIEGLTVRDAVQADDEIPVGRLMVYGHGRIFMIPAEIQGEPSNDMGFIASDPYQPEDPGSVLKFTEAQYLHSGGAFSMPGDFGKIGAMAFFKNNDTGSGYGPLVVIGEAGASVFQVNAPRTQWPDIDVSMVLFSDIGTQSPMGICGMDDDLFFRGIKHIRTVKQAASDVRGGQGPSTYGISAEVQPHIDYDQEAARKHISSVYTGDHIFLTSRGFETSDGDYAFQQLISMNAYVSHALNGNASLVYDGLWTGFDFLGLYTDIRNNNPLLYAFVKKDGGNYIFVETPSGSLDNAVTRIMSRLYTPLMLWKKTYLQGKQIEYVDLWFSEIKTDLDIKVYYRAEGYVDWALLGSGTLKRAASGADHLRERVRMGVSENGTCSPISGRRMDVAEAFLFMVEWTGHAKLLKANFVAEPHEMEYNVLCEESVDKIQTQLVELDDYEYEA